MNGPQAPRPALADLVARAGGRSACLALSKDPHGKVSLLLFPPAGEVPELVAKVPGSDVAARSVEAEIAALSRIDRRSLGPLAATIPRVTAVAEHEGWPVLVMNALPGRLMLAGYHSWRHTARPGAVRADFAAAGRWLAGVQERTAHGSGDLAGMLEGTATAIAARFADDSTAADLAALDALAGRLSGHPVPLVLCHGDFWPGNLLLAGGRVSGVIDWEGARPSGPPACDLARFALSYSLYLDRHARPGRRVPGHRGLRRDGWGAGLRYAIDGTGWYPDLVREFIGSGLARLGVPAALGRDVLLAELAGIAAQADHPGFARNHLLAFRALCPGRPPAGRPRPPAARRGRTWQEAPR